MLSAITLLLLVTAGQAGNAQSKADVAAIKAQSERFSRAYVAEDVATMVSIYTVEGIASPSGSDFIRGREALRRYWQPGSGTDITSHRATPTEIVVDRRQAYDWGYYEGSLVAGGKPQSFRGKYLIVWRKDKDGVWRMAQDMWNSLPPVAPPPPK